MEYKKELRQLAKLPYFDLITLGRLLKLEDQALYMYASRAVKREQFVRLKRGIYVMQKYVRCRPPEVAYLEYLGCKLYVPAYLSLAYVLQKHSVLSESVFSYTLITTNKTYELQNSLAKYLYSSVKPRMFTGYEVMSNKGFQFYRATKAKALFDYLFFITKSWTKITRAAIDSLRLNFDEISDHDKHEFIGFTEELGTNKLKEAGEIICNQ